MSEVFVIVNTWDPGEGEASMHLNLRHVVGAKAAVWGEGDEDGINADPTPDPPPGLWLALSTGDGLFVFMTLGEWLGMVLNANRQVSINSLAALGAGLSGLLEDKT